MPRARRAHRSRGVLILALGAAVLAGAAAGCAGARPRASRAPLAMPAAASVALLPFEDLTGRENVSEEFTRVFLAELVRSGTLPVVEQGLVDEALERLAIRTVRAMTGAEMKRLGDSLHVTHLLFGNVIESGAVHSGGEDLPAVGATLRLVEIASGRVVWACHHSRTGEDRETVFEWGREKSREKLVASLAVEMLDDLRQAGASRARGEKKP